MIPPKRELEKLSLYVHLVIGNFLTQNEMRFEKFEEV
jgi:hypothetical protein